MKFVQFHLPEKGRRVGVVRDGTVLDLTSVAAQWRRTVDVARAALAEGEDMAAVAARALQQNPSVLDYGQLLAAQPGEDRAHLLPPVDHADLHRLRISGTGLTHLGSMQSRDKMHTADESEQSKTDSKRMFELGLAGGKPSAGERGVAPEWFFKGHGSILQGPGAMLEIPGHARDGGEEAELVGIYLIDDHGQPRRLGFALGNEWSDHATEKINYLYLAPSKLRQCAVGPELVTDFDFQELTLNCRVERGGEILYDSGPLFTGERHMCHSLANLEDHHFKFAQHREPGDVHLHFLGTSKLSHCTRDWLYADGDRITIIADGFSAPLVNTVSRAQPDDTPTVVQPL